MTANLSNVRFPDTKTMDAPMFLRSIAANAAILVSDMEPPTGGIAEPAIRREVERFARDVRRNARALARKVEAAIQDITKETIE